MVEYHLRMPNVEEERGFSFGGNYKIKSYERGLYDLVVKEGRRPIGEYSGQQQPRFEVSTSRAVYV